MILKTFLLFSILFGAVHYGHAADPEFFPQFEEAKKKKHKEKSKPAPGPHLFKESALAHQLLDGQRGIEIGASIHNPFGLKTLNVDYTDDITTAFKQEEIAIYGYPLKVDIVSPGDDLPFKDNFWDFVINSHVIEHFYDPVKSIKEWLRVVKPGGYVYMIVPHKERTFDRDRPRTTLAEIIQNHDYPNPPVPDHHGHYSVWITQDFIDICTHYGWTIIAVQDVDDKVGNGFTVVIQKPY
jgi:SAM-dependent methyltransferase